MRTISAFNNMQFKLMLLIFVFTLVPLCGLGLFSVRMAERLILSMATNQVEHVLADKAVLLERWISERKSDLEVIAGSSILRSMDPERIAPFIELATGKYLVYRDMTVISDKGEVIYSSSPGKSGAPAGNRVRGVTAGRLSTSDIYLQPGQAESRFQISAPVQDNSGKIVGAVRAEVGTGAILTAVLSVSLGKTGECYLVNREGTFLAHKESQRILAENISQSESFRNIFHTRKPRHTYTDYRSVEVIGASMMVPGTDWVLVVEQDRDEAFEAADKLKHYVYLVIVLAFSGTLLSAWLVARYVANPIRRLSKAANSLASGEFDNSGTRTSRTDEIGTLYKAFGDMARQLQDRHLRLEEEVTQRESELRKTDARLQLTQQAAIRSQQLASLGQLAAGVAHEIRSPLTSLKMFLESMEAEMDISPLYDEDLHVAMAQVERMESTINRFLNFARPQDPLFSEFEAGELIKDALLVARPRAMQQETVIATEIADALPLLSGDRKQLGEALLNLIINGLEATMCGSRIAISASMSLQHSPEESSECIKIDVTDSGPGIDSKLIPKLFDPFYTTKATGTGLGLSIVYSTIVRHGGQVGVDSRLGQGTTFSLLIPVKARTDV